MLQFLLLAMMLAYVSATTPYTSCHTPDPITYLDIGGCTAQTCQVHPGDTKHITVKFKAPFNTKTLVAYTDETVGILTLPQTHDNDCPRLVPPQTACNIVADQTYTLEYDMSVPIIAPKGKGQVTVTRKGDNDQVISCTTVKIEVV